MKELGGNIQGLEGIVQGKTNNLRVVEEGMARISVSLFPLSPSFVQKTKRFAVTSAKSTLTSALNTFQFSAKSLPLAPNHRRVLRSQNDTVDRVKYNKPLGS